MEPHALGNVYDLVMSLISNEREAWVRFSISSQKGNIFHRWSEKNPKIRLEPVSEIVRYPDIRNLGELLGHSARFMTELCRLL
jgi:hypothetical protein